MNSLHDRITYCLLALIITSFLPAMAFCGNFQGAGTTSVASTSSSQEDNKTTPDSGASSSTDASMTMEQAVSQAEKEIPPVKEVYDVTDPGIVYSQLKPYVDKWRATLPVQTNQWGVDTSSPVVISSSRPDYVPAKLITFIMGELAKENKAGAFGVEGAVATRNDLDKNRSEQVHKRAQEILETYKEEHSPEEHSAEDSSGNSQESNASHSERNDENTSSTEESPSQIDSEPITEESVNAAGIDRDLDGKPDELNSTDKLRDMKAHNTIMKFDDGNIRVMHMLSPAFDDVDTALMKLKENGCDTVYLYLSSGSGPMGTYNAYENNNISDRLSDTLIQNMEGKLKKIKESGLDIIFWLRADGSSTELSTQQQIQYQKDMADTFDSYCSSWVMGYNFNKYFSRELLRELVQSFRKHTSKPIGVHCSSLNKFLWSTYSGADIYYGSYGYGNSPEEIKKRTRKAVEELNGKAVLVATEYHNSPESSEAKALGQAAIEAGAKGTGNGQ